MENKQRLSNDELVQINNGLFYHPDIVDFAVELNSTLFPDEIEELKQKLMETGRLDHVAIYREKEVRGYTGSTTLYCVLKGKLDQCKWYQKMNEKDKELTRKNLI